MLKITEHTDIPAVLDRFKQDCLGRGLSEDELASLYEQVEPCVTDLARRGQELTDIGSQFAVRRILNAPSAKVIISAEFGARPKSFLARLLSLFGRG